MSITLPGFSMESHTISLNFGSTDILVFLLVGLIAGLLASRAVGVGGGILLDMVVGVIGAFFGRWLFGALHVDLGPGLIPEVIVAFVGAAILLLLLRAVTGGFRHRRAV